MRKNVGNARKYRLLPPVLLALLLFCNPMLALADGGAPNLAYVTGSTAGVSVIDVGQGQVARTLAVPGNPQMILLSLDGRFLYVTQPALEAASILLAKTGQIVCTAHLSGEPTLLALNQDGSTLYVAGNGASIVTALDAQNCAVQYTFQTKSHVYGLAYGSNLLNGGNNQLWVAGVQELTVFDGKTDQTLGTISMPQGPQYLSIPPGMMVYVSTRQGTVEVVDFKNHTTHQLLTGGIFGPMDYDALTSEVYVPDKAHNQIDVLTPIDSGLTTLPKEPDRVISLNASPLSIAITNDGLLGFVAMQDGTVAMLDLIGRHIVYTVNVGGNPQFVITGLYPPSGGLTPTATGNSTGASSQLSPAFYILIGATLLFLIVVGLLIRQLLLVRRKI